MKNDSIRFLASKYLQSRSKARIGKTHYLTLAGICLGVAALLIVSSVMNGFQKEMSGRLISSLAEMRISAHSGERLTDYHDIMKQLKAKGFQASPIIRTELMLKRGTVVLPTLSFGVVPQYHKQVSKVLSPSELSSNGFGAGLLTGSMGELAVEDGGILLGAYLAYQLQVNPGDMVQVLSPVFSEPTAFGLLPRIKTLKVLGIVSFGMPEYDQSFSYIPLQTAAYFKSYFDEIDYLEVKTPDINKVRSYALEIKSLYPSLKVADWSEFDPSLYTAMRFEKFLLFIIMFFMYIIASFNLTGNLMRVISQKKKELGLLKALGFKDNDLRMLFIWQALILSSLGIAVGIMIAGVLLFLQKAFGIIRIPLTETDIMTIPVMFKVQDLILIIIISYTFTLISTALPLRRLRQINAVELIRQTV